jgi:hypothetical protein
MNAKITPEHLGRGAVVYIRQSTLGQVMENTESQRRQYALAESASDMGFSSVAVIDDGQIRFRCRCTARVPEARGKCVQWRCWCRFLYRGFTLGEEWAGLAPSGGSLRGGGRAGNRS